MVDKRKFGIGLLLGLTVCVFFVWRMLDGKSAGTFEPRGVETVHVTVPGMKGEVRLAYLSDLHVIVESDQISKEELETVKARIGWSSLDGCPASFLWSQWVNYVNRIQAESLLLGGDMVDFASRDNVSCLAAGLEELQFPYLYMRADHDTQPFYLSEVTPKESGSYQDAIGANEEVLVQAFDDFLVVGWNNATEQMSEEALNQMKRIFAQDKPIVLVTHVPIQSQVDDSLAVQSKEAWQDRELVWGAGCYHDPDVTTQQFLDLVTAPDSPVLEILSGHLHFSWDGWVTETVHQHVFSPAYEGYMGMVTVSGE